MANFLSKIILVDDDEDDRDLFQEAIESLQIQAEFIPFKNGKEFLEYIEKIDCFTNTYVFLDLNMPIISGTEALQFLKQSLGLKAIPVTIYSTSSSPYDIENAYKYGANGYLRKPSSFKELQKMIFKAIQECTNALGQQLPKESFVINE